MTWLLRRWQAKLIAIGMAIALYFFTGHQITIERTLTIRVSESDLRGLPTHYQLSRLYPREFDISVAGPRSLIETINPQAIEPLLVISTEGLTAGVQEFDITERLLRLDPALSLRASGVARVRAEFSRIIEEVLPLAGRPTISGLADGLRADVSLVRAQVLLRGPANVIAQLRSQGNIAVHPIDLSTVSADITEPLEIRVPLLMRLGDLGISTVEQPEAVVRVTPAPESRVIGPIPVQVLINPATLQQYQVDLFPNVIAVTVSGPVNRMREGDISSLVRAYVDITDGQRFDNEDRVVRILSPSWLTTSSTQVRVNMRPRHEDPDLQQLPAPEVEVLIPPSILDPE